MTVANQTKTAEQKLAEALTEIQRLKEQARAEAAKKARFPWQNPDVVESAKEKKYNLAIKPELRLKIDWLMANKGGIRSIQVFFDRAGNKFADDLLKELGAH
jgi:hypothetical protein